MATIGDRALVAAWVAAFAIETGAQVGASRTLDTRLPAGSLTLWRDARGTPVALAGWAREVNGTRRIGPVYTVEEHRRRGYGAAVTAAACRRALDAGTKQLLLYADRQPDEQHALPAARLRARRGPHHAAHHTASLAARRPRVTAAQPRRSPRTNANALLSAFSARWASVIGAGCSPKAGMSLRVVCDGTGGSPAIVLVCTS